MENENSNENIRDSPRKTCDNIVRKNTLREEKQLWRQ